MCMDPTGDGTYIQCLLYNSFFPHRLPSLEPWYWLPDAPNQGPWSGQPGLHREPDSVPTGQGSRQRLPARQGPHWWQHLPQVSWEASWQVTSCLKGKKAITLVPVIPSSPSAGLLCMLFETAGHLILWFVVRLGLEIKFGGGARGMAVWHACLASRRS